MKARLTGDEHMVRRRGCGPHVRAARRRHLLTDAIKEHLHHLPGPARFKAGTRGVWSSARLFFLNEKALPNQAGSSLRVTL